MVYIGSIYLLDFIARLKIAKSCHIFRKVEQVFELFTFVAKELLLPAKTGKEYF